MKKLVWILSILFVATMGASTNAQESDNGRTPITPENVAELTIIAELPTLDNNNFAWSPDSRYLASELDVDGRVHIIIWDTETWEEYRVFDGHLRRIWYLFWSPNGQYLMSASSDDNAVRIWDVENDTLYREFEHQFVVRPAWSPDGSMVSTTGFDEKLRVWNMESGEVVFEATASGGESTACTVWSPDQRWLAAGILEDGDVLLRIWDVATWEIDAEMSPSVLGKCSVWSSDSQEIATLSRGTVVFYDVEDNIFVRSIEQLNTTLIALVWSDDDRLIATGASGGGVMLWDMTTDNFLIPFHGIPERVEGVYSWEIKLSPDGNLLAAPTEDTVVIWDTNTALLVATLRGHSPDVVRLEWSPDGTLLASTDRAGQVFIWGIVDD